MITKKILLAVASLLFFFLISGFQASSEHKILFEKAKFTMETKGDLEGAIKLFQEIIEKFPDEREYAAKSYFYIGLCYEKMGKQEAQKAYQRVIKEFADQKEVVAEARTRLFDLERLAAAEPTGIVVRQVWSDSTTDGSGAPSPDGRYLSYVDRETGDLALYELATGKKRHLTNKGSWEKSKEYAGESKWAPDSKQIVYTWDYTGEGDYELRIIGLEGSRPRILYHNEEIDYVDLYDWSPNGKHILAGLSRKDGTYQSVLILAVDGSVSILKTVDRWISNMCFSPDGQYIVYNSSSGNDYYSNYDINLLSVDGSREIPLVTHSANDYVLGWAPDGNVILFASDRSGTWDAYIIHVANGRPQGDPALIKRGIGQIYPRGFTRKDSFYYYCSMGMYDAYVASTDPETGKILDPPKKLVEHFEGYNTYPVYSPDGKYLAYISQRNTLYAYHVPAGGNRLCILSHETGKVSEFLPKFNRVASPCWSPDCRSILVKGLDRSHRYGIYHFDVQTGNFKPIMILSSGEENLTAPQWSRDGKSIFYGRQNWNAKLIQIFVRNIESGIEEELYRQRAIFVQISISPDGKWLAILIIAEESYTRMLNIMPTKGGELQELCRWDNIGLPSCTWSADGKYILFSKSRMKISDKISDMSGDKNQDDLWRVPIEGGESQKLGLGMKTFYNLSVHPDGRHIAFGSQGSTQRLPEIWVMENFLQESKAE